MNFFNLKHAMALISITTFGLVVGVPLAASGMSVEDFATILLDIFLQWLTPS